MKFILLIALCAALGIAAENGSGDSPFKGNRRPGILVAPTDEPTGENALLYKMIGRMAPDEYLEFLSEVPKPESE